MRFILCCIVDSKGNHNIEFRESFSILLKSSIYMFSVKVFHYEVNVNTCSKQCMWMYMKVLSFTSESKHHN